MKICKYCGMENGDEIKKCRGCGANEFKNKCSNCGTVHEGLFCPNCGVKSGAKPQVCPTCGEIYFTLVCPRCGYSPANRNHAAVPQNATVPHVYKEEKPKKKITVWKILLWIFFLPIMAVIAIWKYDKLNVAAKMLLTVAVGVILLLYSISRIPPSSSTSSVTARNSTSVVETTDAPKTEKRSSERSLATTEPATAPKTAIVPKTETTSAPIQADPTTPPSTADAPTGVTPEFKALMDGYEAFFIEYVQLVKSLENDSYDFAALAKLTQLSLLYSQYLDEIEALENKDMSLADAAYYAEVTGRILSMLYEAIG